MREHVNGPLAKGFGWVYFAIITTAAIAALPLFILTSGGSG
jgi:surface polysaccharide O-acyltransferase-like enzyme